MYLEKNNLQLSVEKELLSSKMQNPGLILHKDGERVGPAAANSSEAENTVSVLTNG
jgi:hypothetical protein